MSKLKAEDVKNHSNDTLGSKINPAPRHTQSISDYFKLANDLQGQPATSEGQDTSPVAPLMDLIISRRQLSETNNELEKKRDEMAGWSQDTVVTWQELKDREISLRENIIRFNTFIKENHDKRERAQSKIEKEKNIQEERNKEIVTLQNQLADLCLVEKNIKEKVDEYQVYKDFLAKAASEAENFSEIFEILNRYEVLAMTSNDLGEQQCSALTAVQNAREQLAQAADVQAQFMMGLQTELAALRVRLDTATSLSAKWDGIVARVRAFAADKSVEIQQVQHSCFDLYKSVCHIRREPLFIGEHNTEQQLSYVTRRIQELRKVVQIAKKRHERHIVGVGTNPQSYTTNV